MHNIIIIWSAYRNIKINIMRSYRTISTYYCNVINDDNDDCADYSDYYYY